MNATVARLVRERILDARTRMTSPITCRADGAVFLALVAAGWHLVALADGWARMEPRRATPQRSAP